MKHWLLTAGAVALMAGIALPVAAADAPACLKREIDPELKAKSAAEDAGIRARLREAIDKGSVPGMIDLAALTEQGDDAEAADHAAALDLYERAAHGGDRTGRQKMCVAYLLGEGRPKDAARGMDFCNVLADDDATGLFARGYDYQTGLTGPADEGVAMGFYIDAVKAGSGDAATAMAGIALKAGKLDLARQWYQRGVYLGSADAMDGLAAMTAAGQGGLTDTIEAGWLYANAARRGNAHAAGQIAGRAEEAEDLCLIPLGKNVPPMTHTYTGKSGPKSETLDYAKVGQLLSDNFPDAAMEAERGGFASIDCYIDARNVFDACILQKEYPATLGFGRILEAMFNGHMTISANDRQGAPTAQKLLSLNVRWLMDSPKANPYVPVLRGGL